MDYPASLDELWSAHCTPRSPDEPTTVSLFSGCGGSSLGFSAAGFRELLAVEWDRVACQIFRRNFPDVPLHEGDVTALDPAALELPPGELDLLATSPPCPGFSMTGLRRESDPRNELWHQVIRLASAWRPRTVIVENVAGLVRGNMKLVFTAICSALREIGYVVKAQLINASALGVPQHRVRVFIVAVRSDLGAAPAFPVPTSRPITVREAWEGLTEPGDFLMPTGKGVRIAAITAPGSSGSEALTTRGGKAAHFSCKRLPMDAPSMTLVRDVRQGTGSGFLHPYEPRFIGTREMSRIQGFPDSWSWADLDYTAIHHAVGNSVCPPVARAIGLALLPLLSAPKARSAR
jgi:DNA (cytosine-5)-methyltransferase 1